jgi:hypothetical protein
MEFLHPAYLAAALALAIPLWLHLRRFRTERRIPFPAVRYLLRARQAYARRWHLRQWLLLAVRLSLVLLLAGAAAGLLCGPGDVRDHPPTRVALVLDNSASTGLVAGDRPVFDLLRERALLTLALATPEDRFWVVPATRPEAATGPWSAAEAEPLVRALVPVPARADLVRAAAHAASLLAGGRGPAEVHVFTDLQATNLAGTAMPPEGVRLVVFAPRTGPAPANLAVSAARPVRTPVQAGEPAGIVVELARFGPGPEAPETASVTVRAVVGGRVVGLATARPGAAATLVLPGAPGEWITGYAEIDPSGLRADDRRWFAIPVRPPARVAVVGDPGPFVDAALAALDSGGRVRRVADPGRADVVWAAEGEGLEGAVARGRLAVVVPGADPLGLPRLNARLERVGVPWSYAYAPDPGLARLGPGAEWVAGAEGLAVRAAYRLEPRVPGAGRVWLRLRSGEPWAVAAEAAGGTRTVLLASPLTDAATELVAHPAMVPFVDALVNGWPGEGADAATELETAELVLPPRATALEDPSGRRRAVEGGAPVGTLDEPGVYRVWAQDSIVQVLVVNPPLPESDLAPAGAEAVGRVWPGAHLVAEDAEERWRAAVFADRRAGDAVPRLAALFLALALLETWLAASGGRGRRDRAAHPGPGREAGAREPAAREPGGRGLGARDAASPSPAESRT